MALTIRNLTNQLNKASPDYAIGGLQRLRAEMHGKRVATSAIFSSQTTFPPWYAFHHGGRTESLRIEIAPELANDEVCGKLAGKNSAAHAVADRHHRH